MTRPLLTIVIPTHNRSQYAVRSIGNVLSVNSDDLQLVVHDSSDNDDLERWVAGRIADPRLVYRHVRVTLSMTDNHNAAMALASGEYVCLIGDDDGINPEIIDAARWAKTCEFDALTPRLAATYCWPDFRTSTFGTRHASRLYVGRISGTWECLDVPCAYRECLANACQGAGNLPKIYHGIVKRGCLEKVFEGAGAYFFGVSPDVSGAIALAPFITKYCVLDYPLTIPGASGNSNTGLSALNKHKGALESHPYMKRFQIIAWPDLVPKFFSVQTAWAQAGVEALRATGREDELRHFDYVMLHALCLWAHPDYALETIGNFVRILRGKKQNLALGLIRLVIAIGKVVLLRMHYLVRRLARPTADGGKDHVESVPDIEAAGRELQRYLHVRRMSLTVVLFES